MPHDDRRQGRQPARPGRRTVEDVASTGTRARPALPLIFAITLTGITVNTLVAPGIPDILDGLGASRGLAGLVLAAATAPGIVLAPAIGVLADRYGRREVLVACLVAFGVAGGLAGLSPNLATLVALRFVQGAGSAGLINLAVVLIGDHWDGVERARFIGRNAAVLTVAVALLPPIGGYLTELGGWRAPFAVYPVALVTAVIIARGLPATDTQPISLREQLRAVAPHLRRPNLVGTLGAGVVLFMLLFGLILTVLPLYAEEAFGLSAGSRGLLLGAPAATSTVAALLLGRGTARFGRRRLVVVGAFAFPAAFALLGVAGGVPLLVVGVLVLGLGEGIAIPSLQDVAAGIPPAESRGTVVAVWVGAVRAGQTIGPVLAGAALAATGARATFAAGAVVALAIPLVLAATQGRES